MADSINQLPQFMAAERQQESGGNYSANNGSSGASGAYQIIFSTWQNWAVEAGYGQYASKPAGDAPPNVQDAVANWAFTNYFHTYGNWTDVAKAWYAGGGWQQDNQTASQNGYPSIDDYAASVIAIMNGGQAGSVAAAPPGTGQSATTGATGTVPNVPGMNDIPALKQYIQQNDPTYAWLLSIPEVSTAFMQGIAAGDSIQQIVAALQQTPWWKSTTTAYRTFLSNYYSSPNDYNFNSQGSTAQGMQSQVEATAATNGVTLNTVQAQTIAIDALKYGWNSQQIQAAIGSQVYVQGANGAQTDAGAVVQQLQSQAGQYLMDPNDPVLNSWAQNIAGGTQTMAQFDAYLKQWASSKWSGMAGQIRNGNTPQQIVSPLQSSIANTLEIAPAQVDFINNPQFGKILDYVPPNSTTGVHQIMTNSQAQQYVKQDAALGYGNTQGARDNAAQLEQAIVQNFGKVGS